MSCFVQFVQFVQIGSLKIAGDVFGPSDAVLRWTRPGWEPGSEQHTMLCQVRPVASVAQLVVPLFTVAHSDSFAHIYKTAGYSSSVIPSNSDFSLFLQNTHRPLVKSWSHSLLVQTPGMMAERMIFFPLTSFFVFAGQPLQIFHHFLSQVCRWGLVCGRFCSDPVQTGLTFWFVWCIWSPRRDQKNANV